MTSTRYIVVLGAPAPQGSFRPMSNRVTGKAFIAPGHTSGYLRYRADIRTEGQRVMAGEPPLWGEVSATITFVLARPDSHFLPVNTRRDEPALKPNAPNFVTGTPDLDKLIRAVLDALTGIAYGDDAQVVALVASKVYTAHWGEAPRTLISINDMEV